MWGWFIVLLPVAGSLVFMVCVFTRDTWVGGLNWSDETEDGGFQECQEQGESVDEDVVPILTAAG